MKLGVFSVLYSDLSLEATLKRLKALGVEMIELGTGGYPGNSHANPDILLNDPSALNRFVALLDQYDIAISALSCHGNPVHPDPEKAEAFHRDFKQTVLLAEELGIDQINTFSGCPGSDIGSQQPNWVTCSWPPEYLDILSYQWDEVLIPYWKDAVRFANDHGIRKIALEMHPGFCVYNTKTLLKLRAAVGETIGVNFDPSHLIWQGMDPIASIHALKGAIYHVHAKDVSLNQYQIAINGVLDTGHYGDLGDRSWIFRTVGHGQSEEFWKKVVAALRIAGYDYAISIEHEDSLMEVDEGLEKAIKFLQEIIVKKQAGEMWWA